LGAARADIEGDLVHPVYMRLHMLPSADLVAAQASLRDAAERWIAAQSAGGGVGATRISYAAEMRYEGQGYDVAATLDEAWLAAGDRDRIAAAFHAAHRAVYGHATEDNEVWLKELRVHITGAIPRPRLRPVREADDAAPTTRPIRVNATTLEANVLGRGALDAGAVVVGPAILNQMDTTTLIPPGWQARLAPSGALILERTNAEARP
jgi:N-methylhydantoinase A